MTQNFVKLDDKDNVEFYIAVFYSIWFKPLDNIPGR